MRRIAISAVMTALAVLTARGGKPGSEWYQPAGSESIHNEATIIDDYAPSVFGVVIGENGKIKPAAGSENAYAYWIENAPGALAIEAALEQALIARNEVETLAENLSSSGIQVSVKTPSGAQQTFTIRYKKNNDGNIVKTTDGIIETEDGKKDILSQSVDNRTVHYGSGPRKLLQLYGTPTDALGVGNVPLLNVNTPSGPMLGWVAPRNLADGGSGVTSGENAVNGKSIEFRSTAAYANKVRERGIQIAGFGGKDYTAVFNVADALTNKVISGVDYGDYSILMRDGSNASAPTVRYVDIGTIAASTSAGGAKLVLDEKSIHTNNTLRTVEMNGFEAAITTSVSGQGNQYQIPYAKAAAQSEEDALAWGNPMTFFSGNFFKISDDTGKVTLNVDGDTDNARVMVVPAGQDPSAAFKKFDGASVVATEGQNSDCIGISGWYSASSSHSISDALVNPQASRDYLLLAKNAQGGTTYVSPGGPLTFPTPPPPDGKAVVYDNGSGTTNLTLFGFVGASDGQFPFASGTGENKTLGWTGFSGEIFVRGESAGAYTDYELVGWADADADKMPFPVKMSTGSGEELYWMHFDGESIAQSEADNDAFEVAGFSSAATNTIPVKVYDVANDAYTLEWRAMPGSAPSAITNRISIVDTDGTAFVATNGIVFASAADSNVEVKGSYTNDGKVKLTIGVYYK